MRKTRSKFLWLVVLLVILAVAGCAGKAATSASPPPAGSQPGSAASFSVYFPRAGQDPAPVLCELYGKANQTLDVAIYGLTHPEIVKAIVDAHKRGVKVRVITDREQAESTVQKHAISTLLLAGIPVKENTHSGLMHLKMSIIDGAIATTGSYNYTKSASEKNDEMLVVIKDPAFVKICQEEFARMWADEKNFVSLENKGKGAKH
ncbi:phospholipase D family protein [Desulfovirgula thermocuniculi]|uniref:phospholipase D family nuclease n=1 Tax=Desulfovirgula thermocuniculi TaxID=348842 RepID=UPI000687F2BD|nr:phospholipase D family protein [Desulfovirgula thermocuniculi]